MDKIGIWGRFSLLLLLLVLSAGCSDSGGGGGGDEPAPVDPIASSVYRFDLLGIETPTKFQPGLEVQWSVANGPEGHARIHPNPGNSMGFTGTIDVDVEEITIRDGTGCDVYDLGESETFGDFRIMIIESLVFPNQSRPESGRIQVDAMDTGGDPARVRVTFLDVVRLEVDAEGDGDYEGVTDYT